MVDFTVAICTYNGEDRLPKVLERLRLQLHTEQFSWEVVIIDNNSTDNTAGIIQNHQADWPEAYPIKYCFESEQGIAFARRLAIKEAQGPLVGFLDDDNLPNSTWVSAAYSFGQTHPQAGVYGSQILGDYEVEPPVNFYRISVSLAIVERGQEPFRYHPRKWKFPAGAGMVVRKQAWLENVPAHPFLKGVCATSLSSKGEDTETILYIRKSNWEVWYNPEMLIHHHIPKWRLERDYLLNLFKGIGLSKFPLYMLQFATWKKPFAFLLYILTALRKLFIHFIRYRKSLRTDIVLACQMELFSNTFISPFYHLKKQWLKNSEGSEVRVLGSGKELP